MRKDKLLLAGGILTGAATGILIGILLAPDKGAETRRNIVKKGEENMDSLKNKFEDFVEDLNEKMNDIRKSVATCTGNNPEEQLKTSL